MAHEPEWTQREGQTWESDLSSGQGSGAPAVTVGVPDAPLRPLCPPAALLSGQPQVLWSCMLGQRECCPHPGPCGFFPLFFPSKGWGQKPSTGRGVGAHTLAPEWTQARVCVGDHLWSAQLGQACRLLLAVSASPRDPAAWEDGFSTPGP